MANKETLSIAPYYGGKGRMAHFLVERLNYRDTNAFISPFGGMCRVLLNKLRHNTEIYNDLNPALCTLINVLSKPDMADEMIERLYTETEFSQDEFDEQKKIYDLVGKDLEQQAKAQVRSLLISKEWNVSLIIVNAVLEKFAYEAVLRSEILKSPSDFEFTYKHSTPVSDKIEELNSIIEEAMGIFIEQRKKWKPYEVEPGKENSDEDSQCEEEPEKKEIPLSLDFLSPNLENSSPKNKLVENMAYWLTLYAYKYERGYIESARDMGVDIPDIEVAMAAFYVFQCSRDGMGQVFSEYKFKDTSAYLKRVMNLYKCAKRLEGVQVHQIDATFYFRSLKFKDDIMSQLLRATVPEEFEFVNGWKTNENLMMMCDPSYISPESEAKRLEGLKIKEGESLSEAILKENDRDRRKLPRNVGGVYNSSFDYEDQENFVKSIQDAKCKIMVCNYDLELYNRYLNESTGWHREEFHTTTSVGGKADNKRVEVVWYNY